MFLWRMVSEGIQAFTVGFEVTVLILVLVEDGLRVKEHQHHASQSLNPCSCGGWSQRFQMRVAALEVASLNPCSCGGWSQRFKLM